MPRRVAASSKANLPAKAEWRREVSDRLQSYRVRRHGAAAAVVQSALPFEEESAIEEVDSVADTPLPAPPERPMQRRQMRTERVEISIPRREMAYPSAQLHARTTPQPGFGPLPVSFLPVVALSVRRKAAMLDMALLLCSYGGMLMLFWALGGRIGFDRLDVVVTVATLALFYAQYFALFTIFGGRTPGMMLCRLRVISFDGGMPTSRQMVWRSFGYLVSAGTCFLGFLWALWDEDQLCWQDRISSTYLIASEDLTEGAIPPRQSASNRPIVHPAGGCS